MPDITMCDNEYCHKRNDCYRYMANPSEYLQSYFYLQFKKEKIEMAKDCRYYIQMTAYLKKEKEQKFEKKKV